MIDKNKTLLWWKWKFQNRDRYEAWKKSFIQNMKSLFIKFSFDNLQSFRKCRILWKTLLCRTSVALGQTFAVDLCAGLRNVFFFLGTFSGLFQKISTHPCGPHWTEYPKMSEFWKILSGFSGIPVKIDKIWGKFMEFQSGSPSIYYRISRCRPVGCVCGYVLE